MQFRVRLIQFLIHVNENLFFYPKLASFYKKTLQIKGPLIFDVGANKGQSIEFFLKIYPSATIYAFEPNYKLFQKLKERFSHLPNVHLINKGVSNQNGKLALKETVTDETSTFEELNYDSEYLKMKSKVLGVSPENVIVDTYEVEVITLGSFIAEYKIEKIDVIKIDTKGHELKCLQGLFSGNNEVNLDILQLEYHRDDMYLNADNVSEIEPYLKAKGYPLIGTIPHGFGRFDELVFRNAP
jgi:FkbM family methyltransferase